MARNAGPAGSGLIPPASSKDEDDDDLETGREGEDETLDDDDLDSDVDDDEDEGGEGGEDRFEAALAKAQADMQRRFDRAVTKIQKRFEDKYSGSSEEDEDDDDEEEEPPAKGKAKTPRRVEKRASGSNVTTIRLMARDLVADEMEGTGREERQSVKRVLDTVLPLIDWSQVDDETEIVEELVTKLKGVTEELVKAGSDRKVAQLRRSGRLPQRPGQPGSAQGGGSSGGLGAKMQKGAAIAAERFPNGQRRLGR